MPRFCIRSIFSARFLACAAALAAGSAGAQSLDRAALVARHAVHLSAPDKLAPLSVGNGDFAFTVDITGLQTFPDFHQDKGIPLGTQSNFAWHEFANEAGYRLEECAVDFDFHGRKVPYLDRDPEGNKAPGKDPKRVAAAAEYFRANPHRFDLGRIGLVTLGEDGKWSAPAMERFGGFRQVLDLWTGRISSSFTLDGVPVEVATLAAPDEAAIGVEIRVAATPPRPLGLRLAFPYAAAGWRDSADWLAEEKHETMLEARAGGATFLRRLSGAGEGTRYSVEAGWSNRREWQRAGRHACVLPVTSGPAESLVVRFLPDNPAGSPVPPAAMPDFAGLAGRTADHWKNFWMSGACIDLSGSKDPRWRELERRIVLSQYLMAVNCSGSLPPQETGLVYNSWHGKFHLEMIWWHMAQFALWGRADSLSGAMGYYNRILPTARATSRIQGFAGARWPKMTGPSGRESPSGIGVFLIWQQPHPIYLAELLYRANPDPATLARWREVVMATAEFMASFATWEETSGSYVLGPTVIPAQECYRGQMHGVVNPTFELAYWGWALDVANQWRERLGLPREKQWDSIARGLARPHTRDGIYSAIAVDPFTRKIDHPSMLMARGFVPANPLIDPVVMGRTLDNVAATWEWHDTWGWDFPMVAMTAVRLNRPAQALDVLFHDSPKNRWLPNGHNWQDERLPVYLPGNGGLLYVAAMMARGWDGAPGVPAPGFPQDGSWSVRHEGLQPAP